MLKIDVNIKNGGLTLDKKFYIDFSELSEGPYLAHVKILFNY